MPPYFPMGILKSFDIPDDIQDKLFEIKLHSDKSVFKIISYFPLSETERQIIISVLNKPDFSAFHSIFTDTVTDDEWNKTKNQIKQRFQNELFDINSKI
ncbi:MAG: hypothetical protein M8317_05330 [Nitrosopumilus sp.]|nr:hypothetical protein [Nitrosopumilus sp.]